MPIRGVSKLTPSLQREKDELQRRIQAAKDRIESKNAAILARDIDDESDDDEDVRQQSMKNYVQIIDDTRDLTLKRLVMTRDGFEIFNKLCYTIDLNQRFAETLPQWKDVAYKLNLDNLKTQWVETCVRPKEGLTRAILEIYSEDGGCLGQVLQALLSLECLEILEKVCPSIDNYVSLSRRQNGDAVAPEKSDKFAFSILKTLLDRFGPEKDPCANIYQYMNGLSHEQPTTTLEHCMIVRGSGDAVSNEDNNLPDFFPAGDITEEKLVKSFDVAKPKKSCKILLVFSGDGVAAASQVVEMAAEVMADVMAKSPDFSDYAIDLVRLNETTSWYWLLANPEAVCMKWTMEADYVMPVITPQFLRDIHCNGLADDDDEFRPTAANINRHIYDLLRKQYTKNRCKNLNVRPVIPEEFIGPVKSAQVFKVDGLFSSTWIPLKREKLKGRLTTLLDQFIKKQTTNLI